MPLTTPFSPCQVFNTFDRDGGGTISTGELGSLMIALGSTPTKEELEATMASFDDDGDGTIGFEEFLQVLLSTSPHLTAPHRIILDPASSSLSPPNPPRS